MIEHLAWIVFGMLIGGQTVLFLFACLVAGRCRECEHERLLKRLREQLR